MPGRSKQRDATPPELPFTEPDEASTSEPTAEPQSPAGRAETRRIRKPAWTTLMPTMTRLYEEIDGRLTAATERTGMGPQQIFELAINAYCDALQPPIPQTMPEESDLKVPRDPNPDPPGTPKSRPTRDAPVRLKRNTRARLVAACKQEQMGGHDLINDAMEAYLDEMDQEQPN